MLPDYPILHISGLSAVASPRMLVLCPQRPSEELLHLRFRVSHAPLLTVDLLRTYEKRQRNH